MNHLRIVPRIAFLAAFVAAGAGAQQPAKLTLDESIEIGLRNSKILHASLMKTAAAEARASQANAATLPSLKIGGSYTRLSDVPPFVASIPAGAFARKHEYLASYCPGPTFRQIP